MDISSPPRHKPMNKKAELALYILLPVIFASLHWICVRVYAEFCAPAGFNGWLVTLFNTANPFCTYTLQMMEITKYFYSQAWIVIGVSSLAFLNRLFKSNTPEQTTTYPIVS
jgi:hypothetical protein